MQAHAVFGAQGDQGFRDDWKACLDLEAEGAVEEDGDDHEFLHGEVVADAASGAGAEGEVDHGVGGWAAFGGEAVGVEFLRVVPIFCAPVEVEDGDDHVGADGDAVAAELVFFGAAASDIPDGGVNAEGFFDDLAGVGKLLEVGAVEAFGGPFGLDFGVEFGFDFGVLGDEGEEPGHGVGGGFVAGDEDGHDFVAKLLVGHAAAGFFFAGFEEHAEEVVALGGVLAAGLDDAQDDAVHGFEGADES